MEILGSFGGVHPSSLPNKSNKFNNFRYKTILQIVNDLEIPIIDIHKEVFEKEENNVRSPCCEFPEIMEDNGENICIHGDGKQKRNFIHGDDIAHACEKILINNTYGEKLILAGNKPTTINQLVSILEQINPSIQVSYSKELAREDDYQGDIGNLEETYSLLNWRPSIDLSQGINRLKEYFNQTII